MNWNNIKLLCRKDWKTSGRNRYFRHLLVNILGWAIALPIIGIFGANSTGRSFTTNLISAIPAFESFSILLTASIAAFLVSDAFAGEKERKTIESLLSSPMYSAGLLHRQDHRPFRGGGIVNLAFMGILGIGFNIGTLVAEKTLFGFRGRVVLDCRHCIALGQLDVCFLGDPDFFARIVSKL